jgi:hypothetical protein
MKKIIYILILSFTFIFVVGCSNEPYQRDGKIWPHHDPGYISKTK